MYAVYDALSEPLRDMLDGMHAVHPMTKTLQLMAAGGPYPDTLDGQMRNVHPCVRMHPETGRKSLFIDELWTEAIVELIPDESAHLLEFLFEHVKKPDLSIRWHWKLNDIVVVDNRSTQHYAVPDYPGDKGVLQKVVLKGERPYGPHDPRPS